MANHILPFFTQLLSTETSPAAEMTAPASKGNSALTKAAEKKTKEECVRKISKDLVLHPSAKTSSLLKAVDADAIFSKIRGKKNPLKVEHATHSFLPFR
jgi:hypothetical protein